MTNPLHFLGRHIVGCICIIKIFCLSSFLCRVFSTTPLLNVNMIKYCKGHLQPDSFLLKNSNDIVPLTVDCFITLWLAVTDFDNLLVSLPACLSVCLSASLFVCLSACLFICLPACLSIHVSLVCPSICPPACPSVCQPTCLPVFPCVGLSVVHPSICPPGCLFFRPSTCLSVRPSVCRFISPSAVNCLTIVWNTT